MLVLYVKLFVQGQVYTTVVMDSEQANQAREKIAEASKLMVGGKTTWLFFKESPDYLGAADLFNEAGNTYKCIKMWAEAGDAFMKAAEADVFAGEPEEGARRQISAASCYKKVYPEKAVEALKSAIQVFLKSGRFHLAASHEKEIAEIYENSLGDLKNAAIYFEKAADRYIAEDSNATALGCQLKAANLAALSEDYAKAIELFSAIAKQWAGDEMKKYSMKEYLTKLGLCLLCAGDLVHAKREIEKFGQLDHTFSSTHESTLVNSCLEALDENDPDKFTEAVANFDQIGLLDEWKTKILLRLKRSIVTEDESLA